MHMKEGSWEEGLLPPSKPASRERSPMEATVLLHSNLPAFVTTKGHCASTLSLTPSFKFIILRKAEIRKGCRGLWANEAPQQGARPWGRLLWHPPLQ